MNRFATTRRAFEDRDADASRSAHAEKIVFEEGHKTTEIESSSLTSIISEKAARSGAVGLSSSLVTLVTCAVIELPCSLVLRLSLGMLFGNCVAMFVALYLNLSDKYAFYQKERARELWETKNFLEGEQNEMTSLYHNKGLPLQDARKVCQLLSQNQELFVDVMMVEELGLLPPVSSRLQRIKEAFMSSFMFLTCGCIPIFLLQYFTDLGGVAVLSTDVDPLKYVLAISFVVLFSYGALMSQYHFSSWWYAGLRLLSCGAVVVSLTRVIVKSMNS